MSWLAIVLFIVEHIPDLISIIKEIIALLKGLPKVDRALARQDISNAIQTGDHDAVRKAVGDVHARCIGVACPSDLVG